jgi:Pvc16 N-terminal domain/Carboxypeptidase regulatory-like domain
VALVTTISLNTSLADLDEFLRILLRQELSATGFDTIEVAFDAPNRDWASRLTQPTVNLFLYELRENRKRRQAHWDGATDGSPNLSRPPLWLDVSYTLTAFSTAVEDEHRLMSQAITALAAYPQLPTDQFAGPLSALAQQYGPLITRVGDPEHDARPDFWVAVGGPYKVAFNYIVTLPFPSGGVFHRGPPVRRQQLVVDDLVTRRPAVEERAQMGGTVLDAGGAPVAGAWVVVPAVGRVAETDDLGHFVLPALPAGTYAISARDQSGRQTTGQFELPGPAPVVRFA